MLGLGAGGYEWQAGLPCLLSVGTPCLRSSRRWGVKVGPGGNSIRRSHAEYPQGNNQCFEAYDYQASLSSKTRHGKLKELTRQLQVVGCRLMMKERAGNRPSVLALPIFSLPRSEDLAPVLGN